MLCVRGLQRLKAAFSPHRNGAHRSLTAAAALQPDTAPLKAEGPTEGPRKGCVLCSVTVDFKNVQLLSQFISPHTGRIYGRHITGLCGKKQREVSKAVKKAHSLGFMPVTHKHPQFMNDPRICGIKHLD